MTMATPAPSSPPPTSARHKLLLESRIRRAKMDNVSAHDLSQILRKASLLWAIPANKELLRNAFTQANRTAKRKMTRYELRRHVNSCVLPEPLSHEEVGLLMTWIEPMKEKTIDFETVEAKLAVLLEGLRSYSEKRSLLHYFNEKFQFGEMLASTQKEKAPNSVGSFATKAEVPPSSTSESKIPIAYSPSNSKSPLFDKRLLHGSPIHTKNSAFNSQTIENLKDGIGELGKRIETLKKEQRNPNYLAPTISRSKQSTTKQSTVSPAKSDTLSVLKQEFQQVGEKAEKISANLAAASKTASPFAAGSEKYYSNVAGEDTASSFQQPVDFTSNIPVTPKSMEAEIIRLRQCVEIEKRAKAANAAELQHAHKVHESMMSDMNVKMNHLESAVAEKSTEVSTLKDALNKAKDDAVIAVQSEKQNTDDLIQREERLLGTLMQQLNKAQNEQLQLDEYADEIDKVYDSLEKLYISLKSDSRPAAPLQIAAAATEEPLQIKPVAAAAHSTPSKANSSVNPFVGSPSTAEQEATSAPSANPDVVKQLTGLKAELNALLRVIG